MIELLDASLSSVNIIPTILLAFILIYWLTVIIGVIDLDTIDFDLDLEVDTDFEVDSEIEVGTDVHGLTTVLAFFNIGQMPFMILLSFLVMPMWLLSVLVNFHLGNNSFLLSILLLIPILFVSLFIAKILTTPIAKFYLKLKLEDEAINPIGKICKVLLSVSDDKVGQAEIMVNGTSIKINAKSQKGEQILKGETALVIERNSKKNYFLIEPYNQ